MYINNVKDNGLSADGRLCIELYFIAQRPQNIKII